MSFLSFNNLQNPSANVLAIKQQQPPPVVDLDVLQAASRVLQEQLLKDAQIIPDHGEMFAYSAYPRPHLVEPPVFSCETAGSSGQYSVFPDDYRVPFLKRKLAGVPEGLFQYFTGASSSCVARRSVLTPRLVANAISHMGLMPEIDRAWVTIDNKLFLWDYVEGCVQRPLHPIKHKN